jgi:hypothetical protein|tara:strand:- start:863 stop:982 length:120 start_codon:yes stop_codon:yes gene_type:complete
MVKATIDNGNIVFSVYDTTINETAVEVSSVWVSDIFSLE